MFGRKNRKSVLNAQFIIAARWKKDYDHSTIMNTLSKMKKEGYDIEEPQLTTVDDINIIIYAHGDNEKIEDIMKHIKKIEGIEKAEYLPLIPV